MTALNLRKLTALLLAVALLSPAAPAATAYTQDAQGAQQPPAKAPEKKADPKPAEQAPAPNPPAQQRPAGERQAGGEEGRAPRDPFSTPTFNGLRFRLIGPAMISGRISSFAVNPQNRAHYFVGVASGGVWKTVNAGTTWQPVFDNEGSYSIGTVVMDPKNPNVVWVGTGENNSQRSVGFGDGVYRSEDGGRTWRNMGLRDSQHIARILIDPRNSNVVYVAAQGPLWGPGGERGLYKTTDGGRNWNKILNISENTGVTDVVMDPRDPDVLLAAAHQRRRHVWTLLHGGPESGLHRSTDGGATWSRVRLGTPADVFGRIGLAVAPSNPDIIYAQVEAANQRGGLYRSTDRGVTWERRNNFDAQGQYYSTVFVDPRDADRVFVMNVQVMMSEDGGATQRALPARFVHVDHHAMWFDPNDPNYILLGNDGGIYESFDRSANWHWKANLPVGQFYDITVDNSSPIYYVYGGTQDNNSLGGPSRTRTSHGITNADWFITNGGDGFQTRVDPVEPNIVYATSQEGGLVRFDRKSGERTGIKPQPPKGGPSMRWNWDSPLLISPHAHTRIYFASNIVFRSDDRGDTWRAISGDITRQIDRNALPVMGKVWGVDAVAKNLSTHFYGNASALVESPRKEGQLYVGTDDGLIQISENGGKDWRKLETFPGVPERTYVSRIVASQHDANTVYAAFDNHKNSDFLPYLLKSTDNGRNWTSIRGDLPERGMVLALAEDHVNPNLLFAGTEFGLYFTLDGGKKWIRMRGGLPTIAVRDLAIQKRENDLVAGTFGRSIYILDNYSLLQTLKPEQLAQEDTILFGVKNALMYIQAAPYGGGRKGAQGESLYVADNPPFGATFTFYMREALRTARQRRQEAEREAERSGKHLPYPTWDQLRAEDAEEAPAVLLTITDAAGNVVRRLVGGTGAGIQRITWDLRFPAANLAGLGGGGFGGGGGGGGQFGPPPEGAGPQQAPSGMLAMPGEYKVTVGKRVNGEYTQLAGPVSFQVGSDGMATLAAADRAALVAFQQKVARLQRAYFGALQTANELNTRIGQIKRALQETPTPDNKLRESANAIEKRLTEILIAMRGDTALQRRFENVPPDIGDRIQAITGSMGASTSKPTQTMQDSYAIGAEEFGRELAKLRGLIEGDVAKLEKAMNDAGAPWTPGRLPEWKE